MRNARPMLRPFAAQGAKRNLNVHEYVSMDVMRSFGIPVPKGGMATNLDEVTQVYKTIIGEGKDCVIKAMVLTGGRGLGHFSNGFKGGVHLCSKPGDVTTFASKMLGSNLITKQTTAEGMPCSKEGQFLSLLRRVAPQLKTWLRHLQNLYSSNQLTSPKATVIIDCCFSNNVADHDHLSGITDEQSSYLATSLGFSPGTPSHKECKSVVEKLYTMFRAHDCTLVEVNPLAETPDGKVVVCDAKINFDDNAEFRQGNHDLNYIGLTGNIGCMVNGAGLAMATMDIIKLKGGDPANFLDVQKAFELLNADKQVKTILVNIFGGIMRCDVIAMGVINAAQNIGMKKPIIIRLKGTNVEEASGFRMIVTDDLEDAANKAVHVADIVRQAEEVALDVQFLSNGGTFVPI
eukprot:gene27846-36687_t